MGLNICLYRRDQTRHPDWDAGRLVGDREFAKLIDSLPHIAERWGDHMDFEWHYRPADFEAWRTALATQEWPTPGRFERLLDLLEADPSYWIYFLILSKQETRNDDL